MSHPGGSNLFYGVDNIFAGFLEEHGGDPEVPKAMAAEIEREFHRLSAALHLGATTLDDIFAALDRALGARVEFPNPFRGEFGLATERGLVSYRTVQSLYQAVRLVQLAPHGGRVLEIGPGMGRTIFYASRAGLECVTADLPIGLVTQACFLGASLGPQALWFASDGESASGRIKLLSMA